MRELTTNKWNLISFSCPDFKFQVSVVTILYLLLTTSCQTGKEVSNDYHVHVYYVTAPARACHVIKEIDFLVKQLIKQLWVCVTWSVTHLHQTSDWNFNLTLIKKYYHTYWLAGGVGGCAIKRQTIVQISCRSLLPQTLFFNYKGHMAAGVILLHLWTVHPGMCRSDMQKLHICL